MAGLRGLQSSGPWIRDVRGKGTMVGVELHQKWSGKGMEMSQRLLEAGFIVDYHAPTATFRLFPPFIISTEEVDAFLQAFRQVLPEEDVH